MTDWIQPLFFEDDLDDNVLDLSARDNDVIITLKERWHNDFLSGVKKFEFRRKFSKKKPKRIVIYVGGEVRAICAIGFCGVPIFGNPDYVIQHASSLGAIPNPESLFRYFNGCHEVCAIPVEKYVPLFPPIDSELLSALAPDFTPPQSYTYVEKYEGLKQYLMDTKVWKE